MADTKQNAPAGAEAKADDSAVQETPKANPEEMKAKAREMLDALPVDSVQDLLASLEEQHKEVQIQNIIEDFQSKLRDLGYNARVNIFQAGEDDGDGDGVKVQRGRPRGRPRGRRTSTRSAGSRNRQQRSSSTSRRGRPSNIDNPEDYDARALIRGLKHYKREHEMSDNALAKQMGITPPTIKKWLAGEGAPQGENLVRVSKFIDSQMAGAK